MVVDSTDTVHLLNPRAQRYLHRSSLVLFRATPLQTICSEPELAELIHTTRLRGRLQRLIWTPHDQELEAIALPGERGWVALTLQSRRSLDAQVEQQQRWVSDVAHELKTPLTALLLVGDSLTAQVNDRSKVLVERLQRELLRLQLLVADLLELSRLEAAAPEQALQKERIDLAELVWNVWSSLQPLASRRDVQLHLECDDHLHLDADGQRLHRALLNLLDNALRHSPEGKAIEVALDHSQGWCRISIRDHGRGLGEEELERMFERFYRGDPARTKIRGGGSGLGLAIVQQIVMTHGGRVQAGNHPDGGARIEVLLPLQLSAEHRREVSSRRRD